MNTPDIYPAHFEERIGFSEVRAQLSAYCSSELGRQLVDTLGASVEFTEIHRALAEASEMISMLSAGQSLPSLILVDCRTALARIRPDRTYMEESELQDLRQMLSALHALHTFFTEETRTGTAEDESLAYRYPTLSQIWVDAPVFPKIEQSLTQLFDLEGRIRDTASKELLRIRRELRETERSLSGTLQRIMRLARTEGWVESDVQPAMRDGRLVIPLSPQHKRKIRGIVHDESATGKTVYVEPVEMVEANNRIRELEGEERREIIRILMEIASRLRPNISHLIHAYNLIAQMDLILAKGRWAIEMQALCPTLADEPRLSWYHARHPLLLRSLRAVGREVVPLDIQLGADTGRILIISGPNAGGKSVCLKTVGLLQYMLQCGLPVPMAEHSEVGIFRRFFIDIGDQQSIEDDLSTYSSHLTNMKHIERNADGHSLILIDEFGGGTEPTIGGAIAEALLERFDQQGAYGVITTHYQNLKTFAEHTPGLINGAMLYDRHLMRPLFRLSIGRPGSSFAIEIARKIGLPESVIARATEQVGAHYIDMDKYLQDIVRDKRYWETKRQNIRKEEKKLQEAADRFSQSADETERARREILREARAEADRIIREANGQIERTIREIREAEAERERTQRIRADLKRYQEELHQEDTPDTSTASEKARRELEKLLRRRERRESGQSKRSKQTAVPLLGTAGIASSQTTPTPDAPSEQVATPQQWRVGDSVRLSGQRGIATITAVGSKEITIALGMIKMNVSPDRLRLVREEEVRKSKSLSGTKSSGSGGQSIIDQIHDKRLHFRSDLDVRGLRAAEAADAVAYFIDDAIQLGVSRVRILHGTGTGALREVIRQYLSGVRGIRRYADEHVQLGGAGITVVDLE